jgi:hypothetical protein
LKEDQLCAGEKTAWKEMEFREGRKQKRQPTGIWLGLSAAEKV